MGIPLYGLGGTVMDGLKIGFGIFAAQRAVDYVLGPRQTVLSFDKCGGHTDDLLKCLIDNGNDVSKCKADMEKLLECRKRKGSSQSLNWISRSDKNLQ